MTGRDHRRLTWVWVDSFKGATCRGPRCGAQITFVANCRTGQAMPLTGRPDLLQTRMQEVENRPGTYRQAALIDLSQAHFGHCPDYTPRVAFNAPRMR